MENPQQHGLQPLYQNYQRQKCFIAYSEKAPWAEDLLAACEEVLTSSAFNLEADYARKHFHPNMTLREKALELIANARYGIYDLSYWQDEKGIWQMPRNVFIELGMAIALNRPMLLLRHASNEQTNLQLPQSLEGIQHRIVTFSGYKTLKTKLSNALTDWVKEEPEVAWRNRYCHFGGRVCDYRETHPRNQQWGKKQIHCHIADGTDVDRSDFHAAIEDVLQRFDDIVYGFLHKQPLAEGYDFLSCSHCQTMRSTPFAIYRLSEKTFAETFITIGMSIAVEAQFGYKIPKMLLADRLQDVPSLLSGYEVVSARNYKERQRLLKKFVPLILTKSRSTFWKPRVLPFHYIQPSTEDIQLDDSEQLSPILSETPLAETHQNWDRFTSETQQVLSFAQEECERLNHSQIDSEHILISLIREESGVGGRTLRELGLDADRVRRMVERLSGEPKASASPFETEPSPHTRRILELAAEEAQRHGQHYIGTEHLLLGLARQNEGMAFVVLRTFGISTEQIRRQTRRVLKEAPVANEPEEEPPQQSSQETRISSKNWDKFTQRARHVLSLAQTESERLNASYIGHEHILIGILREEEGVGGRVLRELGLDAVRIQKMVEHLSRDLSKRESFTANELSPSAKRLLELAVEEAQRHGQHYIGTEHLLLGLARQNEGMAIDVLRKFGISAEQIRRQTRRMLKEGR